MPELPLGEVGQHHQGGVARLRQLLPHRQGGHARHHP